MTEQKRQAVTDLEESLNNLITYDAPDMYSREEWGSKLTFTPFKEDFKRVFGLVNIFSSLPYDLLPDAQLNQIKVKLDATTDHFQNINDLDTSTINNAQQTFQSLGEQVRAHADTITIVTAQWISYLAYQKGDVADNISKLESSIGKADKIIEDARKSIEDKESEIIKIVQQAQDYAGDKGVTIFTEQFNNAAINNATEAKNWLKATVGAFLITIISIVVFLYQLQTITIWYEWLSRAALIGIMITASLWCGGIYRILRHQETTNLHKANGLKSFLLFRDAADNDEATRNAVLLETTKSIFSSQSSGFIKEHGTNNDNGVHIIDANRALNTIGNVSRAVTKSNA